VPVINQVLTDRYAIYNSDCMEVLPTLPAESVGLSVYSPPFPELYQYSDDPRDMSNCTHYQEAIDQYGFIVREIARIMEPGRISAVHCTDLKRDQIRQRDFPADVIRVHEEAGFDYFCRITIWKDPWEFARRTRMRTLMHKTIVEDASCSRVAPADFIVVFRKRGKNAKPILHTEGFREYAGARSIPQELMVNYANYKGDQRGNLMSHWIYRQYASPVWMDIRRGRLLPYREAKENPEERHVCPLQLDVIDRCITMWSNTGDTVLTPFMGVGSEVYEAVRLGRKAIGTELKQTYFRQAVKNLEHVDEFTLSSNIAMPVDDEELDADDDPMLDGPDESDAATLTESPQL